MNWENNLNCLWTLSTNNWLATEFHVVYSNCSQSKWLPNTMRARVVKSTNVWTVFQLCAHSIASKGNRAQRCGKKPAAVKVFEFGGEIVCIFFSSNSNLNPQCFKGSKKEGMKKHTEKTQIDYFVGKGYIKSFIDKELWFSYHEKHTVISLSMPLCQTSLACVMRGESQWRQNYIAHL